MVQVAWSEIWNLDVDPQRERHLLRCPGPPWPGACPGDCDWQWPKHNLSSSLFYTNAVVQVVAYQPPPGYALVPMAEVNSLYVVTTNNQCLSLLTSSIVVKSTFTFSASSYWGSRSTSFIWQGCCLNGKNLNNTKQKILYCIITSAYKMFKVTRLFHPSKCTKWRIKSLCFFCGVAEEI